MVCSLRRLRLDILEEVRLPDAQLAPIIYDLSHTETDGHHRFINYRDMSVQQLGSIYERLLEREPFRKDDGSIAIRPNPYADARTAAVSTRHRS